MDKNSMAVYKRIGERIKAARLEKHMSQIDLADSAHLSVQTLSSIENGKSIMSIENFIRILSVLQVSADAILGMDVPTVRNSYQKDLDSMLLDCTPSESEAILKIVEQLKATLREQRQSQDE